MAVVSFMLFSVDMPTAFDMRPPSPATTMAKLIFPPGFFFFYHQLRNAAFVAEHQQSMALFALIGLSCLFKQLEPMNISIKPLYINGNHIFLGPRYSVGKLGAVKAFLPQSQPIFVI